jgi:HlyD family secretion protein
MPIFGKTHRYFGAILIAAGLATGGTMTFWALPAPDHVVVAGMVAPVAGISEVRVATRGSIRELLVNDGQQVDAGEVVARLDESGARLQLAQLACDIEVLLVRSARLKAERDGSEQIHVPAGLAGRVGEAEIKQLLGAEAKALKLRLSRHAARKALLGERIGLLEEEIRSYVAQAQAKAREISLIDDELRGARQLREKRLVPIARLTQLERDAVRLSGEQNGWLAASIAQARSRVIEIKLQMLQIDQDYQREIAGELTLVAAQLGELRKSRAIVEESLQQAEVRATRGGIVQRLPRRVGDIVAAGDQLMRIAAETPASVTFAAELGSRDAGLLRIGQPAELEFPLRDASGETRIKGTLTQIRAEDRIDRQKGLRQIRAEVAVPPLDAARLEAYAAQSGRAATLVVETHNVDPIGSLVRPIVAALGRALRLVS